ncbi:serine/threonine protein kinase [Streptomyces sp. SM12]|uniref:serine/threonine protein kinase n=1 Tax=Streptomyces sp. SM12 TaxID=1071602 RepID=UPI00215618E5|nr:serine/threonine protein kinase [Streptomyces sp. SM12]
MAERITAASTPEISDEARTSGDEGSMSSQNRTRTASSAPTSPPRTTGGKGGGKAGTPSFADLHSGHKLAKRYRLEECITRLDGFSSWRAVDEKLRRAVGVHVLPADHPRGSSVLAAARSTALLADARFVHVLDADEHFGLIHVIHEWLPDATPISTLLHSGALEAHEAYEMIGQVAAGMAAAHAEGLAHLRLTPGTVLRTGAGLFRIRGLAVDAALRGITHEQPQRADTEAAGALLYAALTQRWPYPDGAYGLQGVAGLDRNSRDTLATPEQVRAGVHRGLSDLAMRALVNDGATAASEKQPCVTAGDIVAALSAMPRIRPPEPEPALVGGYQRTTYQQGTYAGAQVAAAHGALPLATTAPPALPGRMGAALKWGVSALLIAALGLGSWQIADALMGSDTSSSPDSPAPPVPTSPEEDPPPSQVADGPLTIAAIRDFDPYGRADGQNPDAVGNVIDGDPSTSWHTRNYYGPSFANLKPGLGLILDLGEPQQVGSVSVDAVGEHSVQLLAADGTTTGTMPTRFEDFSPVDEAVGASLTLGGEEAFESQYLLVWLTELPMGNDGNYRGRITNITVSD